MSYYSNETLMQLGRQFSGIVSYYQRILDDHFLFAAAVQIPQVATIFDLAADAPLHSVYDTIDLPALLSLIAYRYGFGGIKRMGYGGYAVVVGHDRELVQPSRLDLTDLRRVLRFVPDHHVQSIVGNRRPYDVQLDERSEPIRHPDYPLILSDLFLLPRHTTMLIFHGEGGQIAEAGGRPAILHCQLLPQVIPLNGSGLNRQMAVEAGQMLEAALATLGVAVSDAHGGNGGVLLGHSGEPLLHEGKYIPVVLDYGYYSTIGPKRLASLLAYYEVTAEMVRPLLDTDDQHSLFADPNRSLEERFAAVIADSERAKADFGRLLYDLDPPVLAPMMWIEPSDRHWSTITELNYPPLAHQSRLSTIYPTYDEIMFPQRIEAYHFVLG